MQKSTYRCARKCYYVTVPTGLQLLLPFCTPMICVEGNRFLSTKFQHFRGRGGVPKSAPALTPLSHEIQNISCSPKDQSQNRAPKFLISLPVFKPVMQTYLHPPWNAHLCVSESPSSPSNVLVQDLLRAALNFHVGVQETVCSATLY